jgi:hypothetical protein
MKKGLVAIVVSALMLVLSVSMIAAQEKAPVEKAKAACSMEKATCEKGMKLTDEQKGKVEELKTNFQLKTIDLKAEQQKLGIMLKKEIAKPEPAMQDIEGIIKKMSAVREKLQLARIEHMLAMRKVLGPDWKKIMHPDMGCCPEMMGGPGMKCGGEEQCDRSKCGPTCGPAPMKGRRMMRMKQGMGEKGGCTMHMEQGMGEKGGCTMQKVQGMGEKGGCMMQKVQGMGEKGGCTMHMEQGMGAPDVRVMVQKGGKCCSQAPGKWQGRMFRPFGKKSCGMSCSEKGAEKEIKCKVEIIRED